MLLYFDEEIKSRWLALLRFFDDLVVAYFSGNP